MVKELPAVSIECFIHYSCLWRLHRASVPKLCAALTRHQTQLTRERLGAASRPLNVNVNRTPSVKLVTGTLSLVLMTQPFEP